MIRRLVVPPLEALRPFLPQLNASDTATRETVARILQRIATGVPWAVSARAVASAWAIPKSESAIPWTR